MLKKRSLICPKSTSHIEDTWSDGEGRIPISPFARLGVNELKQAGVGAVTIKTVAKTADRLSTKPPRVPIPKPLKSQPAKANFLLLFNQMG
jgi:hypothetical protein